MACGCMSERPMRFTRRKKLFSKAWPEPCLGRHACESGVSSTPPLLESVTALWNTGSPAFAGDDGEWVAVFAN
jgi:hypothetical protein